MRPLFIERYVVSRGTGGLAGIGLAGLAIGLTYLTGREESETQ